MLGLPATALLVALALLVPHAGLVVCPPALGPALLRRRRRRRPGLSARRHRVHKLAETLGEVLVPVPCRAAGDHHVPGRREEGKPLLLRRRRVPRVRHQRVEDGAGDPAPPGGVPARGGQPHHGLGVGRVYVLAAGARAPCVRHVEVFGDLLHVELLRRRLLLLLLLLLHTPVRRKASHHSAPSLHRLLVFARLVSTPLSSRWRLSPPICLFTIFSPDPLRKRNTAAVARECPASPRSRLPLLLAAFSRRSSQCQWARVSACRHLQPSRPRPQRPLLPVR